MSHSDERGSFFELLSKEDHNISSIILIYSNPYVFRGLHMIVSPHSKVITCITGVIYIIFMKIGNKRDYWVQQVTPNESVVVDRDIYFAVFTKIDCAVFSIKVINLSVNKSEFLEERFNPFSCDLGVDLEPYVFSNSDINAKPVNVNDL